MISIFVGILDKDNRIYSGNEICDSEQDHPEGVYGKITTIIHKIPIIIFITKEVSIVLVNMEEYEMLSQNGMLNCNMPCSWNDQITQLILFDATHFS